MMHTVIIWEENRRLNCKKIVQLIKKKFQNNSLMEQLQADWERLIDLIRLYRIENIPLWSLMDILHSVHL